VQTLYVGNLAADVTAEALRALFAPHGEVLRATVATDPDSGRSRGFGFVDMPDEAAQAAVAALDGLPQADGLLRVNEARNRGARPPRRSW
jgi:RNA recognition motif-containing protein